MEQFTVSIDDTTGDYQFLVSDASKCLLDASSMVRRASHVEPVSPIARMAFYALRTLFGDHGRVADWTRKYRGVWRVNLSPVDGPILPRVYRLRSNAIRAEIAYLEKYFL